jgi:uncharacterized protein YcfL
MRTIFTCVVLAAFAAMGCQSVNTVERAQPEGQPQVVQDHRIITDLDLNSRVQPVGVNESIVSGDLTKIQVNVYNPSSYETRFYYKFEWYDNQEMYVDTPMSIWTDRTIEPGEQMSLVGVAPNPLAKDFKLKIQFSPN